MGAGRRRRSGVAGLALERLQPFERLVFISLAFLASTYESLTSLEPPLQPNTMQISTIAKPTLNAVVISCCPIEYAVAVVELV